MTSGKHSLHTEVQLDEDQRARIALHGPKENPEGQIWYDDHERCVEDDRWAVIVNAQYQTVETKTYVDHPDSLFGRIKKKEQEIEHWETVLRAAGAGETVDEAVQDAYENTREALRERMKEVYDRNECIDELESALDDVPFEDLPDLEMLHEYPSDDYTWDATD